tara:strand:+ start:2112 stop:2288 length:177 start_codon:yes stop_codon:yes gene_type:complete
MNQFVSELLRVSCNPKHGFDAISIAEEIHEWECRPIHFILPEKFSSYLGQSLQSKDQS